MTCSLLYFLDHNSAINKVVEIINKIPSIDNYVAYVKMQAQVLDEYAAKLMSLDIDRFRKETDLFVEASIMLENIDEDDTTINGKLLAIYDRLKIELPWRGYSSFNEFMNDETAILTFK